MQSILIFVCSIFKNTIRGRSEKLHFLRLWTSSRAPVSLSNVCCSFYRSLTFLEYKLFKYKSLTVGLQCTLDSQNSLAWGWNLHVTEGLLSSKVLRSSKTSHNIPRIASCLLPYFLNFSVLIDSGEFINNLSSYEYVKHISLYFSLNLFFDI